MPSTDFDPVLSLRNWRVCYPLGKGLWKKARSFLPAVDGVDLDLYPGRIHALVGESGCGKSTLGSSLVGLTPWSGGDLFIQGKAFDLTSKNAPDLLRQTVQMIFQDSWSSLNPRQTVFELLAEPLAVHGFKGQNGALKELVVQALESVGLDSSALNRFPHAFSGGQRQRICIARVLNLKPRVLVCDEIVSALDISVGAQILELLRSLTSQHQMSILFITHDLATVENLASEISVAYMGKIVESGPVEKVMSKPCHPYTQALLNAMPRMGSQIRPIPLSGEIPTWEECDDLCRFRKRCPQVQNNCHQVALACTSLESKQNFYCHFPLS